MEIIRKRIRGLEGKIQSEMKASVSRKLSVACLAFSLAAAPLVLTITNVYGETMDPNSNEQKTTEQITEASSIETSEQVTEASSTETSAPEVTTADSSSENIEVTSQKTPDTEIKPAEEINSQESIIERETKALPLPDYTITVGKLSLAGEYTQGMDNVPFEIIIPTSTSTLLPAGSTITIDVGASVNLNNLSILSKPANAEVTTDASAGTITIMFKTEVNQDGKLAISLTAPAKTAGKYTIKASSPQWGESMVVGGYKDIEIKAYKAAEKGWGTAYWDTTGKALDSKGVVQASKNAIGYTSQEIIFNNNGDYTPITAVLNLTKIPTPPSTGWAPGLDNFFSDSTSNVGFTNPGYNTIYYEASIQNNQGTSFDLSKLRIYRVSGGADITDKFKYSTRVSADGKTTDVVFSPAVQLTATDYHFAIILPVKFENADGIAQVTTRFSYYHDPKTYVNNSHKGTMVRAASSTAFVPRMRADTTIYTKDASIADYYYKSIPYGEDVKSLLANREGITASDVEDGDVTANIKVADDGGLDSTKPGKYKVVYAVTDSDGNTSNLTVEYTVEKNTGPGYITLHFYDTNGNKLREDAMVTPGQAKIGDAFSFAEKYKEYDFTNKDKYILESITGPGSSATGEGVWSDQGQEITYVFEGLLVFETAPSSLDFGVHEISANKEQYPLLTKDDDLRVADYRTVGKDWTLTASLTKDFESDQSKSPLNSTLYYIDEQGNRSDINLNQSTQITMHKTDSSASVNISEKWANGNPGLVLEVPGSQARAESYQATITWTLDNTVKNN